MELKVTIALSRQLSFYVILESHEADFSGYRWKIQSKMRARLSRADLAPYACAQVPSSHDIPRLS